MELMPNNKNGILRVYNIYLQLTEQSENKGQRERGCHNHLRKIYNSSKIL